MSGWDTIQCKSRVNLRCKSTEQFGSGPVIKGYEALRPDYSNFSMGSFSTTGSCDPTIRTRLTLRGDVTFSIPSADAPWGYLPAGSPVDTSLRYDGCNVPPGGGEFAIPGDLSGSLAMSFDGFVLGTQDDFFFYDEYPYAPQASFDVNQNLTGIHFLWTPNASDWLYIDDWGPGGLNFEGYVDNERVLSGTLLAVPEPGTLTLLVLGLGGIGFARRRKA